MEYLSAQQLLGTRRHEELRDVGDKCLLYSGLFPERAIRKRVSVSYFVNIGQSAYSCVADMVHPEHDHAQLYDALTNQFVSMMDLLQCMREMGGDDQRLSLLQAAELWQDTGSRQALRTVQKSCDGFVPPSFSKRGFSRNS